MTVSIRPRSIDQNSEKSIITQIITDTEFCCAILPIAKQEYFEIKYAKIIFGWCKDYYDKYESAPGKYITDIFNTKKKKLSSEDIELLEDFLQGLSGKYIEDGEKRNNKFYIEEAIIYLKKQSYMRLSENLASYAKLGEVAECENQLVNHKKVEVSTSIAVNLNDPEVAKNILKKSGENKLFSLPGAIGKLLGNFESSRTYVVLAKSGIGKSWFLTELALCAAMNRIKVVMANWEMSQEQVASRYYKRLTGLGDSAQNWNYPCIDCQKSQMGTCNIKSNRIPLVNSSGEIPSFEDSISSGYEPCSKCRNDLDFKAAVWHESIYRDALNTEKLTKTLSGFDLMFGKDMVRSICFPKFSATISDLEREILSLQYREGFFPSVITIDYDALVLPERFYSEQRHNSDEVFKSIGKLSHKYGICIFVASQVNREGAKMKSAKVTSIGDDWRKVQHADGIFILNQSDEEKRNKIIRIGLGKMRDGEWNAENEVIVMQNLGTGQSLLDSEIVRSGR